MAFQTALSGPQLVKLRSASYASDQYISLFSNTVVLAGQVNTDLTTPTTWAQFDYNTVTVGAYTAVELDQALLIGTANDITKATFYGRIRLVPTSDIIYCNESSADFVAGAYFWVINNFVPQYKQSRPSTSDPTTAVELVDYDVAYQAMLPVIVGLQTGYAGFVDSATTKLRIAFDVSASYAAESGATISSYAFTFKAGTYTVISGSLSSAVVTVDFNAGTEQWGKCIVTDSGGRTQTRRFGIKAHDTGSNLPDTGFEGASIEATLERGYTLSIPAFTGVDSVLNNTFAIVWRANENYGGTAGSLTSNNIDFIGWLQREDDPVQGDPAYSVISTASFQFTGIGSRMGRLVAQLLALINSASGTRWGDINNLTPWRAIVHFLSRYTTIANLCDVTFSDTTAAFLFPAISTQGGNVLSAVQGIAAQINAVLEFAPDGRLAVNRDVTYLSTAERAAQTVTVAAWTSQDIISPGGLNRAIEPNPTVGKVDADGVFYDSANTQVTVFTARAPGHAQGEASGSSNLTSQILASTTDASAANIELRQRSGNKFELDNLQEFLDIDHPDGYGGIPLIPSHVQLYTWSLDTTLAGANGVNRAIYDTSISWMIDSVTQQHNAELGARTVKVRYRRVPRVGDPGDDTTQNIPAPGEIAPALPELGQPAFNFELPEITFPEAGLTLAQVNPSLLLPPLIPGTSTRKIVAADGRELVVWSTTKALFLRNFIALTKPQATGITPGDLASYLIKQCVVDPASDFTTEVGLHLLASDGANSAAWYYPNAATPAPVPTKGASAAGLYNVLRATPTSGTIMMYGPAVSSGSSCTDPADFNSTLWPISANPNYPANGTWLTSTLLSTADNASFNQYASAAHTFGSDITVGQINYDAIITNLLPSKYFRIVLYNAAGGVLINTIAAPLPSAINTWQSLSYNFASPITGVRKVLVSPAIGNHTDTIQVRNVTVCDSAASGSSVRVSTDHGALFGSAIAVGTTPGAIGGFDVQRAGTVSYAAADKAVYKATTLGGAYSSFKTFAAGQPVCVIIPFFTWTGTKNTTTATPDVIVGLSASDGTGTLKWIEGGGTVHDITPVASFVFNNANAITVSYSHHLVVFGTVSGVARCYRSTNRGVSWSQVTSITSPTFVRCRRNDNRAVTSGTNLGQIYLCDPNVIDYSYTWLGGGLKPRTMPVSGIVGFDTIF